MSEFEYIVGIHTIVLGLATTKLLSTLVDHAKHRAAIRSYWVHPLWVVSIQLVILGWWWAVWREFHDTTSFSYLLFLGEFSVSIAFYVAASFVSFNPAEDNLSDLERYFYEIKTPMFMALIYGFTYLTLRIAVTGSTTSAGKIPWLDALGILVLLIPLVGILTSNRRVHAVLAVSFFLAFLASEMNQPSIGQ